VPDQPKLPDAHCPEPTAVLTPDRSVVKASVRKKLAAPNTDLERALRVRVSIDAAIKNGEKHLKDLAKRKGVIGQQEGRIHSAIRELERTLEAISV